MGDRHWQEREYERAERLQGIRTALARVFGDGENPLAWGFRFASLGPTPIKIHILFLVYLLVELIFTLPGNRDGILFVLPRLLALVALVLAREICRTIATTRLGGNPIDIMLWPLGGLTMPEPPQQWGDRAKANLAPLACNLILLPVLALPLYLITRDWQPLLFNPLTLRGIDSVITFPDGTTAWWLVALGAVHAVNLMLLLLNLLPMYPLDGARLLEDFLSRNHPDHRARWIAVHTGLVCATAVGLFALVMQDATALFALCVVCGLICSMQRRQLQFLATADLIPGIIADRNTHQQNSPTQSRVPQAEQPTVDEEEIDRILAKISKSGIDTLTRKERRTLKQATETSRQSR